MVRDAYHIGSVNSMASGRLRFVLTNGQRVLPPSLWQNLDLYLSSPVSFLFLSAFCRINAGAYVSGIAKLVAKSTTAAIKTTQLIHLQPAPWYTNPPMIGPSTGPFIGARA